MSLFDLHFKYTEKTESPLIYHRWSLIGSLSAFLGRRFWLPFGPWKIFPNQYLMLVGNPGTRKNAAINLATSLIGEAGYNSFSANKTRLEKFLLDLEGETFDPSAQDEERAARKGNIVIRNIFGADALNGEMEENCEGLEPKEVFIAAPEFNVFMPRGDMDFLGLLGELWDWDNDKRKFKHRLKNSKSVAIYQPTITILSGNTHAGIQEVFPPQAIGQGIFSRFLFIYSEPSGKKITFPETPPEAVKLQIVASLKQIKEKVVGPAVLAPQARNALDMIYRTWHDLEDQRFKHYSTRRFTHLLKLCLVCCATRISTTIELADVLLASSLLSFTEAVMPKALGEFGKSRNAEAANKIMVVLYETKKPLKIEQLWKVVQNDLEKMADLANLLNNLSNAEKVQYVKGEGFLPKQRPLDQQRMYVDYNLLKEYKQ